MFTIPATENVTYERRAITIVKAIIEAHGGTVTVESKLGAGSTFTLRLPNL